ncbi:MAG: mechanosensitive ion channel [Candidatus Lokiarchaeota archaeon]|nr:mechanosensitive ion channel [Candidatus Lokiarchaeota archaeon]
MESRQQKHKFGDIKVALFKTDFEALIYFIIIGVAIFLINKIISSIVGRIKKIPLKEKIIIKFFLKIISIFVIIFFIIESFPIFSYIPPEFVAILTSSISVAIAFASSGIFANLISGIVLMIIRPFDVGDLVKIQNDKGIIRSIGLTKTILETFDNILIEKSNSQISSSTIVNYTIKLGRRKSFEDFKKKILAPQDKGRLMIEETLGDMYLESELKEAYNKLPSKFYPKLYNYSFRMTFPYKRFRLIIEKIEELCLKYKDSGIFRLKPRFDIVDFGFKITIKFRVLTFSPQKIFDYQPKFAKEVYNIIYRYRTI